MIVVQLAEAKQASLLMSAQQNGHILQDSSKIQRQTINSESPSVYKLLPKEENTDIDGCRRYSFGKESTRQNRTIMLFGANRSGKSTLISGMINYIVGVKWKDNFRFKLGSQAEGQTSEVTVYKINHQEGFQTDYSLTIVDIPGFRDTGGIKTESEITEHLHNLFSAQFGVSEVDAVCFVTQAPLSQFTPSQKYMFESVLSIFGKDVAENIRVLVTFADVQCPPVLEGINASDVPCCLKQQTGCRFTSNSIILRCLQTTNHLQQAAQVGMMKMEALIRCFGTWRQET